MSMGTTTNRPMSGLLNRLIRRGKLTMMTGTEPHITSSISLHHTNTISIPTPMGSRLTLVCPPHRTDHRIMVPCHNRPRCTTRALPCITNNIFMITAPPTSTRHCLRLILVCASTRTRQDHHRTTYLLHLRLTTPQASLRPTTGDKTDTHPRQ